MALEDLPGPYVTLELNPFELGLICGTLHSHKDSREFRPLVELLNRCHRLAETYYPRPKEPQP